MIVIDRSTGLAVNPLEVSHMHFSESNGQGLLEITMNTGERLRVKHWPHMDGPNIYKIHDELLAATNEREWTPEDRAMVVELVADGFRSSGPLERALLREGR